jgi:hypothetical protein
MRMMAILAFALCCHVVYAGDLHSMLSTYMRTAGCGTAQIAETTRCIQGAFDAMNSSDSCENFGKFSPCWPKCFCDNPLGFQHLIGAFKPQCTEMPPCGAALGARKPRDAKYKIKGVGDAKYKVKGVGDAKYGVRRTQRTAYEKILKKHRLLNPAQAQARADDDEAGVRPR